MEPTAMTTDVINWLWKPPASEMSNLKLSKQRQVYSV